MRDEAKYQRSKRRLRKFLKGVIAECEQFARDIAWWNEYRTDAPPFDRGGDICAAALARQLLERVEADQILPDDLWDRFHEQLKANARM